MVGNPVVDINQEFDNFYIAGKWYKDTPVVTERSLMKRAQIYNKHDISEYKYIRNQRIETISFTEW